MMGQEGGSLLAHVKTYHPRADITEIYEVAPPKELPPRRFLFVFGDRSMDAHHFWLDLEAPTEEQDDCQVVRMPFGADAWRTSISKVYISMREMLFVWAMRYVYLPRFPHHSDYLLLSWDKAPKSLRGAEDVVLLFERLGFNRLDYPRHCLLFERDDASIMLYQPIDGSGLSIKVGMRELTELRRFQAIIEDNTGMKKY